MVHLNFNSVAHLFDVFFVFSGPNGTPFHPHVSMENKLEEQHKKGKRKNLPTEKTPKRTYRSPGNVSELVDAPLRWQDLLHARGTPGRLERDREPRMHIMEERSKENPKLQRSQPITTEYGELHFSLSN